MAHDLGGGFLPDHLRSRLEELEARVFGSGVAGLAEARAAAAVGAGTIAARLRGIEARCADVETADSRACADLRALLRPARCLFVCAGCGCVDVCVCVCVCVCDRLGESERAVASS